MRISVTMKRVLRDVHRRSKGWPCGIPAPRRTAAALVVRDLAEYAPPVFNYPNYPACIRLTIMGKLEIGAR